MFGPKLRFGLGSVQQPARGPIYCVKVRPLRECRTVKDMGPSSRAPWALGFIGSEGAPIKECAEGPSISPFAYLASFYGSRTADRSGCHPGSPLRFAPAKSADNCPQSSVKIHDIIVLLCYW